MENRIKQIVHELNLEPHPEGGYYKEYYRSPEIIRQDALPDRFKGDRCFSTSIYYLIHGKYPSKFHRLSSDEIWHFYEGSPVDVHIISENGDYKIITMGEKDSGIPLYQLVIGQNSWFGGIVKNPDSYSLVGCTVAPGFDFADFEMADRTYLLNIYPQHGHIIDLLS